MDHNHAVAPTFPTITWTPHAICLKCSVTAVNHGETINHNMVYWNPRWGIVQFKTGMCTVCSTAQAVYGDYCAFCVAAYWKARPALIERLQSRNIVIAGLT